MTILERIRRLACVAAVAIAGLALASPARAQTMLSISASESGPNGPGTFSASTTTAPLTLSSGPSAIQVGDYSIVVLSAAAGMSPLSEETSSTTTITNTTGSTNVGTLTIVLTAQGFTSPSAPTVHGVSSIGGTVFNESSAASDTLHFLSTVSGAAPPFTLQSPDVSSVGAYSNTQSSNFSVFSAPFTITETITIFLGALNDQLNYSSSTTVTAVAAVPEPSSIVLAGLGSLGIIGYGLRRRKALSV